MELYLFAKLCSLMIFIMLTDCQTLANVGEYVLSNNICCSKDYASVYESVFVFLTSSGCYRFELEDEQLCISSNQQGISSDQEITTLVFGFKGPHENYAKENSTLQSSYSTQIDIFKAGWITNETAYWSANVSLVHNIEGKLQRLKAMKGNHFQCFMYLYKKHFRYHAAIVCLIFNETTYRPSSLPFLGIADDNGLHIQDFGLIKRNDYQCYILSVLFYSETTEEVFFSDRMQGVTFSYRSSFTPQSFEMTSVETKYIKENTIPYEETLEIKGEVDVEYILSLLLFYTTLLFSICTLCCCGCVYIFVNKSDSNFQGLKAPTHFLYWIFPNHHPSPYRKYPPSHKEEGENDRFTDGETEVFSKDDEPKLSQLQILEIGDKKVKIIESVCFDWRKVGELMDFDDHGSTVTVIGLQHDRIEEKFTEVLKLWLRRKSRKYQPVTWRTLITLLNESGHSDLAVELDAYIK